MLGACCPLEPCGLVRSIHCEAQAPMVPPCGHSRNEELHALLTRMVQRHLTNPPLAPHHTHNTFEIAFLPTHTHTQYIYIYIHTYIYMYYHV
jgi:hypothetical protein